MRLRALDAAIIAASAALVAAAALWAYAPGAGAPMAVIKGEGGEWLYPLDADRGIRVEGPHGDTVIRIEGGLASIESSPCANQTCVSSGTLSRPGQWAACLPNKVMLLIEGGREDAEVDATAY